MSELSPRLALPFLMAGQAQKHVSHNEALILLDGLVQSTVQEFAAETPPADPAEGQVWALGPAPTDAWAGQEGDLALWFDGAWQFITPAPGWRAAQGTDLRIFDGADWVAPALQNLPGAGINATHDATNRLTVAAPATLLTHEGAGHQLKLNKASAADTASLLFQTGFSGRAEMGTPGADDFAIKVSPDGAAWFDAFVADRTSGLVNLPNGLAVTGAVTLAAPLALANGGTGAATAADARANLGLGTAATATMATSNTDTTAGRLPAVGYMGLGATGLIAVTLATDGSQVPVGFSNTNSTINAAVGLPSTAAALTMRGLSARQVQLFGTVGSGFANRFFGRTQNADSVWEPLTEFYHMRNLLGPVGQSGGLPTGAVIQRGSNANGEFVRFADGTLICTHTLTGPATATADGGLFTASANQTWIFPSAFAAAPLVTGSVRSAATTGGVAMRGALSASSVDWRPWSAATQASGFACYLQAIGRWF